MKNAFFNEMPVPLNNLFHEFDGPPLRYGPALALLLGNKLPEIAILTELHNHIDDPIGIVHIIALDDIPMIEFGMQLNLIPDEFHLVWCEFFLFYGFDGIGFGGFLYLCGFVDF